MNQLLLILGALWALSAIGKNNNEHDSWNWFKREFNKSYETKEVELMRQTIFMRNKDVIESFNHRYQGEPESFSLGLNHLADIGGLEINAMNGFVWPKHQVTGESLKIKNSPRSEQFLRAILDDNSTIPDSIDWRQVPGRVSEVKNQGACGSCWAFASTGTLEGQEKAKPELRPSSASAQLTELSEQNLVDCVKADYGCQGGFMKDALEFVAQEKGIDDEQSYPYEARTRKCRFRPDKVAFTDSGAALLPSGDEEALKKVVAKFGPVAVGIDASSIWFQFYRHGVYYNKHCKNKENQLDHGVLVVGYGTDPKKGDYWIVKNSWGPQYGEKGYIRMSRNRNNNCGIATAATIPTF